MVNRLFVFGVLVMVLVGVVGAVQPVAARSPDPTRVGLATTPLSVALTALQRQSEVQLASGCAYNVTITSLANGLYVSAEIDYSGDWHGMLRARATAIGPRELFTLCNHGAYYTLQSQANGRYVAVELSHRGDEYGMLRARATEIGPWEQLSFPQHNDGTLVIYSQANRRYVSAELAYSGVWKDMLRARASEVGAWERFR